ncbi:erythromycin esterase family protein [Streptomyces avicenniae]|uniref:erythromycin esterase family protein n=1 Tax=Streptomyces avicenniae TaxID=500153 RepID=UPI00069B248E|nr:erythromycin esterase family protein [Streptomyces avicenniae]
MRHFPSTTVRDWLDAVARPLDVTAADAPADDPRPLLHLTRDAGVVALGTAVRAAREPSVAAHRALRTLVEEAGFRALLLEGDDPVRTGVAAYIAGEGDDPDTLVATARTFWRTEDIVVLLRWLRAFNARHPTDPVRFVPVPDGGGDVERALADGASDWHGRTGDRVVHWGGYAHTAAAPIGERRTAGSLLRERLGAAYVSVGITFHHGLIPVPLDPPGPELAEAVLGTAAADAYLLDLTATEGAPQAVLDWLTGPARVRIIGPDPIHPGIASGASLRDWFDALVHIRELTPARPSVTGHR